MNEDKKCNRSAMCAYSVAVVGAFLIVAGLVWVMHVYTRPEPLGEDRAVVRRKTLADVRQSDADVLYTPSYAWQDQTKGVVRIPINDAKELALRWWKNPVQAREKLMSRAQKAFYVPPPPPTKFD